MYIGFKSFLLNRYILSVIKALISYLSPLPDVVLFSKQLELFDADIESDRTSTPASKMNSADSSIKTHDSGKMIFFDRNVAIALLFYTQYFRWSIFLPH